MNYYNEIDSFCARWLRNLIAAGLIAPGDVDERSIEDVTPNDLRGYAQCHFFAGIGGWSYALRLAGWPDDRPVWTGSCPCQPFSSAGKKSGFADERHLWPAWFWLIGERRPDIVFGEQVASAAGLSWLDLVCSDLESLDYSCGAVDLPAASVGAPHIRQRLWFVAHLSGKRCPGSEKRRGGIPGGDAPDERSRFANCCADDRMADAAQCRAERLSDKEGITVANSYRSCQVGFWSSADWLLCRDGKFRPAESGTFPLAHGVPARMGRLRAYGNAIVPQVAAEVIAAFMEIEQEGLAEEA